MRKILSAAGARASFALPAGKSEGIFPARIMTTHSAPSRRRPPWAVVLICLLPFLSAPLARSQPLEARTQTLTNGLKLIVHEDHSIPSAVSYLFYRVGSRNERPGTTGISHFFEHMMFNGAKKYGPKQFDVAMEAAGGSNNAYTDYDVTVYQDWFPPTALGLIFDLESDRIAHLAFDPKMIESERGVVASERRTSVEANNASMLDEQLWAAAFTAHPYQWPVIGWMVDIEHWSVEDLRRHFEMGYAPNNAVMVVAGDVKFDSVLELARHHLEPIPSRKPPLPVTTREPEQSGERRIQLSKFAQLPMLMLGYHVPEAAHDDFFPLQVLRTILFYGQSSRLYQRLVDNDQLAVSVDGSLNVSLDPTLFTIAIQPKEGASTGKIEAALYEELDRLKSGGPEERELQKAKNALLATFYRSRKTINSKAQSLGNFEVFFGDYRKLFTAAERYSAVSAADIKRVATRYFTEKNRTVATLVPEKAETATPAQP
jgi:zinc protease